MTNTVLSVLKILARVQPFVSVVAKNRGDITFHEENPPPMRIKSREDDVAGDAFAVLYDVRDVREHICRARHGRTVLDHCA